MIYSRKSINKHKQAFTLIELLIILAIVGVLLSVIIISLNVARNRAKDNSFKTTAQSIQTSLVSCCLVSTATLNSVPGGPVCASSGNYPDLKNIGSITIDNFCDGAGNFAVIITPGTKNRGTITSATINSTDITYAP